MGLRQPWQAPRRAAHAPKSAAIDHRPRPAAAQSWGPTAGRGRRQGLRPNMLPETTGKMVRKRLLAGDLLWRPCWLPPRWPMLGSAGFAGHDPSVKRDIARIGAK